MKGTINNVLTLEPDDTNILMWYIDVALAVHVDMKSHTGAVLTVGKGAIISISTKQKVNFAKLHKIRVDCCGQQNSQDSMDEAFSKMARIPSENKYCLPREYQQD